MPPEAPPQQLWLVDGSGIFFRAFHALPTLSTRRGLPTGAVYGFTSMLAKLLRESRPTHIAVVLDAPGKTFRAEAVATYKATRSEMPSDLVPQLPYIRRIVDALGIPLLEMSGVEADDVIGTLATKAARADVDVQIVTSDKDFMQLVGPRVTLVDTMHDRVTRVAEVRGRFGVEPAQVVEVVALMGDAIDNIPGVKGIGEKTASRLIAHFGSIEELYARLPEVETLDLRGAKRISAALKEGEESARSSRFLATIRCDLPIELQLESLVRGSPDRAKLVALVSELEFASLLREFLTDAPGEASWKPAVVVSGDEVDRRIRSATTLALAFCYEAHGGVKSKPAAGIAVALPDGEEIFFSHTVPDSVRELLAGRGAGVTVIVEDLKAALHAVGLDRDGLLEQGENVICDTQLASYVLDPSRRAHGIESLANDRLGRQLPAPTDLMPAQHASAVAEMLLEIGPALLAELVASGLAPLYHDLELPLARVLAIVEERGIAVDRQALEDAGRDFRATAAALESEIFALAGGPFNLQSPIRLREVLFERLKLPTKGIRKGKTGLSVDSEVLTRLAESNPIAAKICDHRALSKLISTYVTGLATLIDPATGRLYTSFNQTVAATGRLSSSEPNLQNIPIRTAEGRRIRAALIASPGMLLLAGDYSQIELRVLAHLTGEPALVEGFARGEDVHRRTAAEVFGVPSAGVMPEMRRQAKVINFGILYGMGPQRLSRELGIPIAEAEAIIRRYFERYSRVREFVDRVVAEGRRLGYVSTLIGRRRYLPDLNAREPNIRQAAERMAWNSPIQGTAADIIKLAMLAVEREVARTKSPARMLLQVHDELVLEVPEPQLDSVSDLLRRCMESVVELAVPLVVELKRGPNWAAVQ